MKKYIVFDFDGTIVDSKSQFLIIFNKGMKENGLRELSEEEFDIISAKVTKVSLVKRLKLLGLPNYRIPLMIARLPKIAMKMTDEFKHSIDSLQVMKGIENLLSDLSNKGYTLAIISTNSDSNIKKYLKVKQIDKFDSIYPSKGLLGKTSTIKKFLKDMNIKKDEMVYIGDELRDIVACKKAGVKMIAVTWGFNTHEVLSEGNPDYVAHTTEELSRYIDGIFGSEKSLI